MTEIPLASGPDNESPERLRLDAEAPGSPTQERRGSLSQSSTIIRFRLEGRNVTVYRETITVEVFGTKEVDSDMRIPEDIEAYRKNLEAYFREPVEQER